MVNNKSKVIPIAKLFGFVLNIDVWEMKTISPIKRKGIPTNTKFF